MVTVEGMISVAEAAKRLNRSIEQVRRYLREGKLKGQRVGNQWFVDEASLRPSRPQPLIPPELARRIEETREAIYRRNGITFDVVELLRETREDH